MLNQNRIDGTNVLGLMFYCLVLVSWGCGDEGSADNAASDAMMSADVSSTFDAETPSMVDATHVSDADSVDMETPDAQLFDAMVMDSTMTDAGDAVVDEMDADLPSVDAETANTLDAATLEPDVGSRLPVLGCNVGDVWTFLIQAVPPPGMGCQQGGGSGQADVTHRIVVGNPMGGPNSFTGYVVRPDRVTPFTQVGADSVILEGTFTEENGACVFSGFASLGVNFPPDGSCGNRPTEVRMTYQYLLRSTEGVVDGTGTVISEYGSFPPGSGMDPASVEPCRAPCSEPLIMNGNAETL